MAIGCCRYLTFQADCPYLVGSYAEIGAKLKEFAAKGLTTIMLDMVADETEMQHVCKALKASGIVLARHAERAEPRQWLAALRPSQKLHDMTLQADELGFGDEVVAAWPRERQHDILDHAAGPCAHHDDAVGEEQRLVDVVGDEHGGRRDLAPDVEQDLLHHARASARRAR